MHPLQIVVRHRPRAISRPGTGTRSTAIQAATATGQRLGPARAPRPRPPACNGRPRRRHCRRRSPRQRPGRRRGNGPHRPRRRAQPALEIAGIDEVAVQIGDLSGGGGGGDVGVGAAVEFLPRTASCSIAHWMIRRSNGASIAILPRPFRRWRSMRSAFSSRSTCGKYSEGCTWRSRTRDIEYQVLVLSRVRRNKITSSGRGGSPMLTRSPAVMPPRSRPQLAPSRSTRAGAAGGDDARR